MSTPRKPDLDHLIRALTADGLPGELAGRDAARDAFRAAGQRRTLFRRALTAFPPFASRGAARLAAAGAVLVIVAVGVFAAAYTQTLPAPVQDLVHTVFAPLGVPDARPGRLPAGLVPATGSTGVTIATPGKTAGPPRRTPSPRPGGDYLVTVAVSRARGPSGGTVTFSGRITSRGRAAAQVRVRLYERLAGSTQFQLVATGLTGPRGGFRLPSPPLTATAVFRVVGPDSAHSVAVRVVVADPGVTTGATGLSAGQAPTDRG